ncbi:MAG: GNAT family N-acetyltransferase [Deltaproteobacteria bacterium]|nr:MAG: GNAT family N-acetyltransferase [Deltaproteobacteria bacterium]
MHRIDLDTLYERAGEYDAAVASRTEVDRFCTSSDWILPAHEELMPPREPLLFRDGDAWIAFARGRHERGFTYLEPLEASWALASPVVGAEPEALVAVCANHRWDVLLLAGLLDGTDAKRRLLAELGRRYDLRRGATTVRHVADLAAGVDGYLARRSRNFRRSLSRARRRARDAGVDIVAADREPPDAAIARVLAVDARSWKGRAGVGIEGSGLRGFYARMVGRLAARGALRLRFARHGDRDVAFILGGVFGDTYRGLQFAYDADWARIGLGNLCQIEQMAALCSEGIAVYDLGTTGGRYKRRWADRTVASTLYVVVNA